MLNFPSVGVMTLAAALVALPVVAQQSGVAQQPAAPPTGVAPAVGNPNLAVASVRLENGTRASKVIGAAVYTDQNERIGTVDDLVMTGEDKVTVAVVSVGGFLGLGSKLVAIPFDQLKRDNDRVVLAGATKDTLNAMPSLVY